MARFPQSATSVAYRIKAEWASKIHAIWWAAGPDSIHALRAGETATTIITRSASGAGFDGTNGVITGNITSYFTDSESGGFGGLRQNDALVLMASWRGDIFSGAGVNPFGIATVAPPDTFQGGARIRLENTEVKWNIAGGAGGQGADAAGNDVVDWITFAFRSDPNDATAQIRPWLNGSESTARRSNGVADNSNQIANVWLGGSFNGTGNNFGHWECALIADALSDADMATITANPAVILEEVPAGDPPDAPTIGAVTNVTHNSATINWTDNSADEDGFKVEYGESSGGTVSSWSEASNSPTAADAESLNLSGLDPETTYKARVAATNENGDSSFVETAEFTTDPTPDTTPPTLTSPTATATGQTTASGSVTTNEGNGTLYYLASANSTESAATVKGGDSQAVSATGVQNVGVTGLTHSTGYYLHFVHVDAAENESDVASSSQFTTDAPPPPATKGVRIQLSAGGESLTGLLVRWWDDPEASGAPDYEADDETTDASGWLEIDLDSTTALDIDDPGYLLIVKQGASADDDMIAGGRVPIVDIGE